MRAFLRSAPVIVPLALLVLIGLTPAQAQYKINTFDSATADTQFVVVYNVTANATEPYPYHFLSDDATEKVEGLASFKSDWRVHTTETWGGMNMLSFTLPVQSDSGYYDKVYRSIHGDSTYLDWSSGTHLSLWYNTAVPSTATGNGVQMRFHIYEAGEGSQYYNGVSTDYEDWYYQSPLPVNDTNPGWHELIIPLVDEGKTNSPNDQGFSLTDWSGTNHNNKLDWDKIIGYTIEWTAGKVANDTASGILFYDDLRLNGIGERPGYAPLYRFNNFAQASTDFANGWNNGGLSGITFREETVDTLMGSSVMGWDWAINVKEDWGGGCNREYNLPADTYFPSLDSTKALYLYCKVVQPLTSSNGTIGNKITMRVVLFDYSDGQKEEWYTIAPVHLDSAGVKMGWQVVVLPLDWIQSGAWGDLKSGQFNTPNGTKDGVMALNKIGGFKLEFSSSRDAGEPYAPDLVYSGKILFSAVVPGGFRETDHTPPAAVTEVQITPSTNSNLITWKDVDGETGATYTGFVSESSFTSTDDPGVENVPSITGGFSIPTNTQILTHLLRSPNTDQQVSLYYGITATDRAGNTNQPTVVGPTSNTAKGVPTISLAPPANFVADGDLSEWSAIPPFVLSVDAAHPTAYVAPNMIINGDADLKVTAYVAVDNTYLYVAFDVDDDVVSIDTSASASDWLQDCPDMFIGLYDWRGKHHSSYRHGTVPDYHLRFAENRIRIDNDNVILLAPGENYVFNLKQLTSGYTIEARIPWTTFHELVPSDSLFTPVEGMRIPIDFEINDNDTPGNNQGREGIMCYSILNNDLSYADVWRWTYTWIGNKSTIGAVQPSNIVYEYSLMQNYPNPFNPSTVIKYSLAKAGPVTLRVFDVLGRVVATLVNGEVQSPGEHQVVFGSKSLRNGAASGVYFFRIESGSFSAVKKMVMLK